MTTQLTNTLSPFMQENGYYHEPRVYRAFGYGDEYTFAQTHNSAMCEAAKRSSFVFQTGIYYVNGKTVFVTEQTPVFDNRNWSEIEWFVKVRLGKYMGMCAISRIEDNNDQSDSVNWWAE